jgi:protease-4
MFAKFADYLRSIFRGRNEDLDQLERLPVDGEMQVALANTVLADIIKERRQQRFWTFLRRSLFAVVAIFGVLYYVMFQMSILGWRLMPVKDIVGVVRIEGPISSGSLASAEKVIPVLRKAFEAENVKAVVLSIDSPGGSPVEAERINYIIDELKRKHNKPVYAVIHNVGASAAYMISLHADEIYAGRYSIVGSIGAVMASWDLHKALARLDVYQKVYASGNLKAMLNPFIESTPAAENKAQSIVDLMGQRFYSELKAKRGHALVSDIQYDSGEVWDGETAKTIGLIDAVATIEQVANEKHPGIKLHEMGPGANKLDLFSASIGDWLQSLGREAVAGALIQESVIR